MPIPGQPLPSSPTALSHQAMIAQSLRFAGVDGATAGRIAQHGPSGVHPDLSQVFVHDSPAQSGAIHGHTPQAAHSLSAAAYSSGTQIAIRSAPDRHLLAHELTHVVQQGQGIR